MTSVWMWPGTDGQLHAVTEDVVIPGATHYRALCGHQVPQTARLAPTTGTRHTACINAIQHLIDHHQT